MWRAKKNVFAEEGRALIHRAQLCFVLAGAALLFAGCSSLPNVQPFSEATLGLKSAVASGGVAVTSELRRVEIEGAGDAAADLEKAWATRNQLFSGLVEYANSLQAIVSSGERGAESARALAGSVQNLAATAGLVAPGGGAAAEAVTDAAAFVYEQVARARAARNLERALAEVQPAIEKIAETMSEDMKDLDDLMRLAARAQKSTFQQNFQREIAFRRTLLNERAELLAQLQSALAGGTSPSNLSGRQQLEAVDDLLASVNEASAPMDQQLVEINAREQLARRLIGEIQAGLANWSMAHGQMLAAVRLKQVPSVAELKEASQRIRNIVEKFEAL